jgi:cell pole-organizing protein PopZ
VAPPALDVEGLVDETAAAAAAGAFGRLAGSMRLAHMEGQTIEGVVRELLRPMLKQWLDDNLRAIVEAKVEAEVERISRRAL